MMRPVRRAGRNGRVLERQEQERRRRRRSTTTTPTQPRPAGPSADMSQELTGGKGVFIAAGDAHECAADSGTPSTTIVATGTATSYKVARRADRTTAVGRSCPTRPRRTARECSCARRRTQTKFSGTVVVEWLNVSGGVDADPDWASLSEEIVRRGDAWVGVSAQRIGVEGGPVLVSVQGIPGAEDQGKGLKKIDPARYGTLEHPGDGYSFDIFTQVARALRSGAGLGGVRPARLIAAGESQSAFALVTYFNGVQPLAHAFDGFFVHSRGAGGAAARRAGQVPPTSSAIARRDIDDLPHRPGRARARHPDRDRRGEHPQLVRGAPTRHRSLPALGGRRYRARRRAPRRPGHRVHRLRRADQQRPDARRRQGRAARAHDLDRNGQGAGRRAPHRRGAGCDTDRPAQRRRHRARRHPDAAGRRTRRGAVRRAGPEPIGRSACCSARRSPSPRRGSPSSIRRAQTYEQRYDAAADAAIKAGFVLPEDRAALLAFAEPSRIAG